MPSLPQPGETNWGNKLNEFILTGHNIDGTLKGVFSGVLNPKDFGAKGDGLNNDAPAFQAMVDSVPANGRASVVIPPGTYKLNTVITVTNKFISWYGCGPNVTELRFLTSGFDVNAPTADPNGKPTLLIKDMSILSIGIVTNGVTPNTFAIKYRGTTTTGIGGSALLASNLVIEGLDWNNNAFGVIFDIADCQKGRIENVMALGKNGVHVADPNDPTSTTAYFVKIGRNSTGLQIHHCEIFLVHTCVGILDGTSEGIYVSDCIFVKCHRGVVADKSLTGGAMGGLQVFRNHIAVFKEAVLLIRGSTGTGVNEVHISENYILPRGDALATEASVGIKVGGERIHITNNLLLLNTGGPGASYTGITIDSASGGPEVNVVTGNIIQNYNNNASIILAAGTQGNVITSNIINGTGGILDNGVPASDNPNIIRFNIGSNANKMDICRVKKSVTQAIPNTDPSTYQGTQVTFDTEIFDRFNTFNAAGSYISIPGGVTQVRLTAGVRFDVPSGTTNTNSGIYSLAIFKSNPATDVLICRQVIESTSGKGIKNPDGSGDGIALCVDSGVITTTGGEQFSIWVHQHTDDTTLNILNTPETFFSVEFHR